MENIADKCFLNLLSVTATATDDVTSDVQDCQGYKSMGFAVIYGNSSDTLSASVYWEAKLQECATSGGTYTDVATADILIAPTNSFGLVNSGTEDSKLYWIGYNGSKRYVKVVVTATGTHTYGTPITIISVPGMPRSQSEDGQYNP